MDAPDQNQPAPPTQGPTITNPVDLAKAVAGLVLQEAVNLGEINPAMQRRFGERMDQLFRALVLGAGVAWTPNGDLKIIYPEVENPILAEANRKKQLRESTAVRDGYSIPEADLGNLPNG